MIRRGDGTKGRHAGDMSHLFIPLLNGDGNRWRTSDDHGLEAGYRSGRQGRASGQPSRCLSHPNA